ncbi:MAG TPA: hypothetical protein DCX54_05895 [Flavobacteriales bacterium]|nr:hypothetical protein [Flavobacteriales bacterium]
MLLSMGCKSFEPTLLNPDGTVFNPKLPSMEAVVENNLVAIVNSGGQTIGANPQDVRTYFDREVKELMTDPYNDKAGVLLLNVNTIENKHQFIGYMMASVYTISLFNVLGGPYSVSKSSVEVEIEVLNKNNRLIGSYRGNGSAKLHQGYYSKTNYNQVDQQRISYLKAVKNAVQDAKSKLIPDLDRLISELDN